MIPIVETSPPVKLAAYLFPRNEGRQNPFNETLYTFRGRDAISVLCELVGLKEGESVLLPGYLCESVVGAFGGRYNIRYYDVKHDLSIDCNALEDIVKSRRPRIVYLIHYFGFLSPNLSEMSHICRKYNALLVEDHAHSAFSRFSWEYGDAMVFSFRKMMPIPDGGGVWVKGAGGTPRYKFKNSVLMSDLMSLGIFVKRIASLRSPSFRRAIGAVLQKDIDLRMAGKKLSSTRPASHFAERIVNSVDKAELVLKRREMFEKWLQILATTRFVPMFRSLPIDVCPLGCPIWCSNSEELVPRAESEGVFLKVHWKPLPRNAEDQCPTAAEVSRSVLTLPIYPGLPPTDLERISNLLDRYGKPLRVI